MLNVTCMREVSIFRGSVSFLMFQTCWTCSVYPQPVRARRPRAQLWDYQLAVKIGNVRKHAKVWNLKSFKKKRKEMKRKKQLPKFQCKVSRFSKRVLFFCISDWLLFCLLCFGFCRCLAHGNLKHVVNLHCIYIYGNSGLLRRSCDCPR